MLLGNTVLVPHLTRASEVIGRTHADLHIVGVATGGKALGDLQHGAA